MIKNYLRVAFRTFLKNKSYIVINALGLGISLACCIAAYLLLAFNIEFDNFHDDQARMYDSILNRQRQTIILDRCLNNSPDDLGLLTSTDKVKREINCHF